MSAQNKEIMPMELANEINRWNYDKSVIKMRPLVREWKKATVEMLRELYLAREFLTNQKGQYKDMSADNYLLNSWSSYCEELGLSYQTANNWLRPFTPRELSETGKDTLMLAPPMKTETTESDRALSQLRMKEVLYSGERQSDWTDEEEKEYQKILENARIAAMVEKCAAMTYFKPNDYFSEAMKHSKAIISFKHDRPEQQQAQHKIFRLIEEYLHCFDNLETKSTAAFNLALKARNISNEIAEKNFQIKNAQEEESDNDC